MVAARYQVESLLGEGGYGAVYVAVQHPLGRRVALKILHPEVLAKDTARERFIREAELTQRINHPNVVRLFDFGTTEHGMPFIVWELLEGRSLEAELARVGALSLPRALRITSQILKALAEAHARGIVHRDIKPANVFLSDFAGEPDFVKVLDFGIAAAPKEGAHSHLTQEGLSLGTPAYMPPEQVLDEPLDGRADLYAVGLLMSEMVSGRCVFAGEGPMHIAMMQLETTPPPHDPRVLASALGAVIARATQKVKDHRFGSALEMLQALGTVSISGALSAPDTLASPAWPASGPATLQHAPTAAAVLVQRQSAPLASPQAFAPLAPQRAPGRRSTALWVAVAVLMSITIAAVGIAAVRMSGASSEREREARRASKATAGEDDESGDPDFDNLEGEIMKGVVKSLGSMGKCPPLSAKVAAFSVQGLTIEQLLARFVGAGYQCVAHNDLGRFGNFTLTQGSRAVTVHYGPKTLVMVKDQPHTRSLADPNGNVIVLLAASDAEAAAAGEVAVGRAPAK